MLLVPYRLMGKSLILLVLGCLATFAGDTAERKQNVLWQKLEQNIQNVTSQLDGVAGVAILDLTNRRQWGYHADEVFPTASTIKLSILADLYHEEELALQGDRGHSRLSDRYTVRLQDLVEDSAVLGNMTPGVTTLTNRDLAGAVVAVSDNSASNILASRLGMDRVNAMLDGLHLTQTRLRRQMMDLKAAQQGRENVATPAELVQLLTAIYDGKLFRPALKQDFFTLLTTTKDSWIPRLIPEGVKIANKPGALAGVRCDAGIVFVPQHPFVLVVMTTYDRDEHAAQETISQVAQLTWRMFDVMSVSSEYGRQITERNSH